MSKLVDNEQSKLTATYMNGIAIALITVGVLAPIVAILTGAVTSATIVVLLVCGCVIASAGLHYGARQILAGLKE